MALILDTNALSAFVDGDSDLRAVIAVEEELALPSVVLGEYLFGIRQSKYRTRYEAWLRQHGGLFTVFPVGANTATGYADIRSELRAAGQPIPSNDIWIAAIARERGYALVSRDSHFRLVRGIDVISW
jgi:predicted nucleic acid-binding protein